MVEFTAEYATGIDMIDSEHKMLFSIVNEANDLIADNLLHDKYDHIVKILDELCAYTKKHFADEEKYMKLIKYPKLSVQQEQHEIFIEKLEEIDLQKLDSIDENQDTYLVELMDFLLGWLTNHILKMDKLIGEWEREQLSKA